MSQPNADPSVQNGLPNKWEGAKNPNFTQYALNNGVGSSQSSRDSSPIPKFSNVPISQLPPSRSQIPSSQLPPGRPAFSPIAPLIKSASVISNTPQSSPKIQNFNTSTPITQNTEVTSAGNNYTGSNSFINVSLTSSGNVPHNMPNPNNRNTNTVTLSPVQNGNQVTGTLKQNLNQPITTNTLFSHTGNLLTNQPGNDIPAFMPVSGQTQFQNTSQPSLRVAQPTTVQNEPQKPPINLQSHFSNPIRLSSQAMPAQNVPVSGTQLHGQLQAVLHPATPISTQNQPGISHLNHKTSNAPPVPFSQLQNQLPIGPQQKMGHMSAFAPVAAQKQHSQSTGNLAGPQNISKMRAMNPQLTTSSQNIRQQNPQQNINHGVQNIRPPNYTNPLLIGAQTTSLNNQMISTPNQNPGIIQQQHITNQNPGIMNQQYTPNQNTGLNQQYKPISNQNPVIGPPTNQNTGLNQQYKPISNQNPVIGPPANQNTGIMTQNTQFTKSGNLNPLLGPPMANQNQQLGPVTNQHTVNQHYGPLPTNQGPPASVAANKITGNQQYTSPTNINAGNPLGPPQMLQNQQFRPNATQPETGIIPQQGVNQNTLIGPPTSQINPNIPITGDGIIQPPSYQQKTETFAPTQYPTTPTSTLHGKRYPTQKYQGATQNVAPIVGSQGYKPNVPNQSYQQSYGQNYQHLTQGLTNMSLGQSGFSRIYGNENFDLLQCPNILPPERIEAPRVCLGQDFLNAANCSPEIFRCTMTKIPESSSLLQKSRLPLGVLIHPFKDLNHLPVIQCSTIVRCRACRTYINPFVFFVDTKRWKCNLCYRVNELPEEFQYDPVSKSYGDPSRRPEIKSSTIEYIAPSEYMLRPPQPAVYLFLLDISLLAIQSGYLHTICTTLSSQLATLPGDSRTQVGFLGYNSTLHFFSLGEGLSQPREMVVSDVEDVFLPCPDSLLVNLKERMELVDDLLTLLPTRYLESFDSGCALGAALQAAFKLMSSTGGRVTVFQASLPTLGPGTLTVREDPNQRAGKEAPHLNPATDFYKRLALECSGHQVAVDMFILNSQYVDIATLSGISRFSGGCIHHFPLFKASKTIHSESLERCFRRYLTRKIGFEAVMRIRCTRGLAVHTFHGNFFVRSTDLLSLPNVNPDAGFGMQVSIEESLSDLQSVCFQAALLYTSSKGERRIRVHTLCLPVVNNLAEVLSSADQQCIVGILAKMAVDRSLQSSLSDARDAFINVAIDILHSFKVSLNMGEAANGLLASHSLKLLPLYILALLKYVAFRSGQSTRLDDRVFAMCEMKTQPLAQLLQQVYPDLYPIHDLTDEGAFTDSDGIVIPQPPRIQLTARNIDAFGVYLLDAGQQMIIFVCQNASPTYLSLVLGVPNYSAISDQFYELPKLENPDNQRLHTFIGSLNDEKPYCASLQIMRENSPNRTLFLERLIEDRIESALSYNEFLQHIKTQVK